MTLAVAALLLAAIAAPHALRLERIAPATAATIWMSALLLRALTAVFCAMFVVIYLPGTDLFRIVTHWCLHEVVPLLAIHLGLDGHRLGDFAVVAPAFFLAASMLWVLFGVWLAARRVHRFLLRQAIGRGPGESLIVRGSEVFVAAAGLRRPAVLVSAGALATFDDEELAASLEHEQGHIVRRHRFVLLAGEVCRALGRSLPGTRRAAHELAFHLERDADRYASDRHEPLALASAICKAATSPAFSAPATALAGGSTARRVQLLMGELPAADARGQAAASGLAALLVVLVIAAAAMLPDVAHAGYHGASGTGDIRHCAT